MDKWHGIDDNLLYLNIFKKCSSRQIHGKLKCCENILPSPVWPCLCLILCSCISLLYWTLCCISCVTAAIQTTFTVIIIQNVGQYCSFVLCDLQRRTPACLACWALRGWCAGWSSQTERCIKTWPWSPALRRPEHTQRHQTKHILNLCTTKLTHINHVSIIFNDFIIKIKGPALRLSTSCSVYCETATVLRSPLSSWSKSSPEAPFSPAEQNKTIKTNRYPESSPV